jgi:hypothetical protein
MLAQLPDVKQAKGGVERPLQNFDIDKDKKRQLQQGVSFIFQKKTILWD